MKKLYIIFTLIMSLGVSAQDFGFECEDIISPADAISVVGNVTYSAYRGHPSRPAIQPGDDGFYDASGSLFVLSLTYIGDVTYEVVTFDDSGIPDGLDSMIDRNVNGTRNVAYSFPGRNARIRISDSDGYYLLEVFVKF